MVQNSIYGQSYIGYTWIMFVIVVFIANKRASFRKIKTCSSRSILITSTFDNFDMTITM